MTRPLLALVLMLFSAESLGHKPSDSYLHLNVGGTAVTGRWDIALRDLDYAIGLDGDGDGAITWGELRHRHDAVATYALAHLDIGADGDACKLRVRRQRVDHHSDGTYAILYIDARCPGAIRTLSVRYDLFFDLDPQHRGLLRVAHGGAHRMLIMSPENPEQNVDVAEATPWRELTAYGREGVWHILIGYDHVLFLLSLLLPAVLRRSAAGWVATEGFGQSFLDVVKVVTAFTIAHSVTLSVAALGVVTLPARWVESAIAASIVVAAVNNLYPVIHRKRWAVAFCFGLVHGFGFAIVLTDLGLPPSARVLALLGFNLGVELGQLMIVCAFLPIAYRLRATPFYRRIALGLGSLAIAALGAFWLIERSLDLDLPIV
jgi:hypothetical protein